MTAPHADQIVDGYLARLEVALAGEPAARRAELLEDIRAHIAEARAALADETDAALLELVERLGDPRAIATDATERIDAPQRDDAPPATAGRDPRWGWLEVAAVLLTVMAWPLGAILVLLSSAWTRREKLTGIGLGAIPFVINTIFAPVMAMTMGSLMSASYVPPIVPILFAVVGALPLIAAGYLAFRLYGRASYLRGLTT